MKALPRQLALPLLLVAVALPVLPKLQNGFVYDDQRVIVESDFIHDPDNAARAFTNHTLIAAGQPGQHSVDSYRPLTLLTFFWDAQLSGRDPLSYHLTNLALHLACVALLFVFARRLFDDARWAGFAAGFFGLSPWLGEAHVWINGRSDPACAAFGLASLLMFRRALEARSQRTRALASVASALLFFLGLLCKEVLLLALPAFVLTMDAGSGIRQRLRATLPLVVSAAAYLAIRMTVLSGLRAAADGRQLAQALARLPLLWIDGLSKLLLPAPPYLRSMAEDYDRLSSGWAIAALAIAIALAYLAYRFRRRVPLLGFGLALYALTLAPAAVIATMSWGGFGRYLYLPAVGIAIALTALLRAGLSSEHLDHRRRRLIGMGAAGYLVVLGAVLALSVPMYHDEESYFSAAIEAAPDNALGYSLMGTTREQQEHFAEAAGLYRHALALDPRRPKYATALGGVLLALGDDAGARAVAEDYLPRVPPTARDSFHAIVIGSVFTSDPPLAVEHLVTCLESQPESERCRRWARVLSTHPELARVYRPLLDAARREHPELRW